MVTDPQTDTQTGAITMHSTAASAQCNKTRLDRALFILKTGFGPRTANSQHTYCCTEYTCGLTETVIGALAAPGQTRTIMLFCNTCNAT